jgi:glycosyltransferase 2 family protein
LSGVRLKKWLAPSAVLAFVACCLLALRRDLTELSLAPVLRAWDLLLLAGLLSIVNYALRIVRWRSYLARLGHELTLGFSAVTYVAGFAFTLSPGKVGELARARYYQPLGIPVAQVAGAVFVERLVDLLAVLVLGSLIFAGAGHYRTAVWGVFGGIVATLSLLAVFPWSRLASTVASRTRIPRAVRRSVGAAAEALVAARRLLRPDILALGFGLGLLAWSLEGVELAVLASMFAAPHLPLAAVVGIYAVAVLAGVLSFLPGGLGSTEAVMTALLAARGMPMAEAILLTITFRLMTLWFAVALGWLAVWMLRYRVAAPVTSWR